MGRTTGRVVAATASAVVVLTGSFAWAEEAPRSVRVPVDRLARQPDRVIVEQGDHLWKISERALLDRSGPEPSDPEIAPYWRDVIAANLEGLRSGDADLIYAGEEIVLPAIEQR